MIKNKTTRNLGFIKRSRRSLDAPVALKTMLISGWHESQILLIWINNI